MKLIYEIAKVRIAILGFILGYFITNYEVFSDNTHLIVLIISLILYIFLDCCEKFNPK